MAYKNFKLTEIIEEIGAELRRIRIEKQLTISHVTSQLAESGLHISNTLMSRVETGERRIDDELLNTLCKFYDVNPRTVVTAASQAHIRRLTSAEYSENIKAGVPAHNLDSQIENIISLYQNLNAEGQKEIATLMRLMAYMDSFKKLN